MPGVALIFSNDGAAIAERRLREIARRTAYRGTHVTIQLGAGGGIAAIAHDPRRGIGSVGGWHVALDGRIDNRAELAAVLGRPHPGPDGADDAALIAAALERWNGDAAPRLIGDFAVAAVHADEPRALVIRDVRGLRPLYYRERGGEWIGASDLQALVRDGEPRVNEHFVAEWLTGAPASHSDTLYEGIRRLPMAHVFEISRGSSRRRQYWMPSIDPAPSAHSEDRRAEAFVGTLQESVRARTAGAERAALWLSGGLDSSTLAVMLSDTFDGRWQCFTMVHPASRIDEREFAQSVAASLGATHAIVEAAAVTRQQIADEVAATLDLPPPPNGLQSQPGRRFVREQGFPIALSGLGSDEWFGGSFLSYGDLVNTGQYRQLVRTVWADRHREESTRVRLQIAAWSLCPPWLQRGVRAALNRRLTPPWISAPLAHAASLEDRLRTNEVAAPELPSLAQRALYDDNIRAAYVAAVEMQERANACCGLDERYPFHDRRVIELSLALPESDRWAAGRSKDVIRRAMAGRLPAAITGRQASPNANVLVAATLSHLGGRRFFERLQIAERRWVDGAAVLRLWDRFASQRSPGVEVWHLWAIAAVELWAVHAGAAAAPQSGATTSVA